MKNFKFLLAVAAFVSFTAGVVNATCNQRAKVGRGDETASTEHRTAKASMPASAAKAAKR